MREEDFETVERISQGEPFIFEDGDGFWVFHDGKDLGRVTG